MAEMYRAALYVRVSTEEQALKGLSPEAQRESLVEYAKNNNYIIVDTYIDDGKTARKELSQRKEFQRLISDVKQNKIDLILVTKLDRWFRNVADYHATQTILEKHGCNWKTTKENYDTTSASGRLHINIMLSVAQDEADRTSERIKAVFDYKLNRNEVISGALPMGFKIIDKHLAIDEDTQPIVLAMFEHFEMTASIRASLLYVQENFISDIRYSTVRKMITNPLYKGFYRDNTSYCEAIIEPERFDHIQTLIKKNVRVCQNNRDYIFSGLLICKTCGKRMTGFTRTNHRNGNTFIYAYYRCNNNNMQKLCSFNHVVCESSLEKYLLNKIKPCLESYISSFNIENIKKPMKKDTSKIKAKMKKLKELYVNDLIDIDDYKKDYDMYTKQLNEVIEVGQVKDIAFLKRFLDDVNVFDAYDTFNKKEKRAFWLSIIDKIEVAENREYKIIFL